MKKGLFCIVLLLVAMIPQPVRVTAAAPPGWEAYTYALTQSTSAYQFWTTPPSERVFKNSPIPQASGSEVKLYAARNEFEPFVVVVRPAATGVVTVSIDSFGAGITSELYQVKYVNITTPTDSLGQTGPYPDPLWPVQNGASVAVTNGENTAFWFSVSIPKAIPSQDYLTQVHIGGIAIPVRLHVFNFAIPDQLHVASQMNFSYETILSAYSVPGYDTDYWSYVDKIKQFFIDHRLTPSGVLWPGGLTYGGTFADPLIDYNCSTHTLTDNYGIWGFVDLAQRYVSGSGLLNGQFSAPFNGGTGFSSLLVASMADNDPSIDQRPNPFCGIARQPSDWLQNPTSTYNTAWFAYITAVQNYLRAEGYLGNAYDYIANEPQDQADYNAVAWYSHYSHAAAPDLKLMVSEEPKPEIYDQPGAHIDIWLPVLENYDPVVSQERAVNHNEDSWIYFLHSTRPPYFNPITLDHPGVDSLFTGWFLWKYRVRGIAYYSLNDWSSQNPWVSPMTSGQNGDTFMLYPPAVNDQAIPYGSNGDRLVPSIRLELMRDSLEDYEYLYLLGGGQPQIGQVNPADAQVDKVITGLTSYTRDSEFLYNLRRLIGLKIGGEIAAIPDLQPPAHNPRALGAPGNYYINFQDPAGQPAANPLVVNGKTYLKIGASNYNPTDGYGWYAPPDVHWKTAWLSGAPNVLQQSVLYSDYGRRATWVFDLPNGQYNVTLSVGWQGGTYLHQKAVINGVSFVNDEATTPAAPYLVRTGAITVSGHQLSLEMGIAGEYTMLNYLDIEAADIPVSDLHLTQAISGGGQLNTTLAWTPPSTAASITLRYSNAPITANNWAGAAVLAAALPGSQASYSSSLPTTGGTLYFALEYQDAQGRWSALSNQVFWPSFNVHLPLVTK